MCERVEEENSYTLIYCLDECKIQEMCERAAEDNTYLLGFVPASIRHRKWVV